MNLQNLPIEYLNISLRAYLALKRIGVHTVNDVMRTDLSRVRFLGRGNIESVIQALQNADDSTKYFDL